MPALAIGAAHDATASDDECEGATPHGLSAATRPPLLMPASTAGAGVPAVLPAAPAFVPPPPAVLLAALPPRALPLEPPMPPRPALARAAAPDLPEPPEPDAALASRSMPASRLS